MTNTLTEQWREGTLPDGYYYIIANTKARNQVIFYLPENTNTDGAVIKGEVVNGEDGGWVVEVLDPVPSYEELREKEVIYNTTSKCNETLLWENESLKNKVGKLQEQLNEANMKLENELGNFDDLSKKVERLQKQLNEANKALKEVCMHCETEHFECRCGWVEPCKDCNAHYAARDYLEKWGVK